MMQNDEREKHARLQAGFDRAAADYDSTVGLNPCMRYMREVSLKTLERAFLPGQRVLEIGCGTGDEALALARRGVRVLATDVSPRMVEATERKAAAAGVAHLIETRVLAASALMELGDLVPVGGLDGAYSSFGPLNGEAQLEPVARALTRFVRPQGWFVASAMARYCLFEILWFLIHGQARHALRRWSGHAQASVSASSPARVPTWYYTPTSFERSFAPAFRRASCRALPLVLPPPYLSGLWGRWPKLWAQLEPLDGALSGVRPLSALGDHFMMMLRRV